MRRKAKESEGRVAHVRGRGLGDGAGWRWDALAARDGWCSPLPETRGRIAVGASLAVCGTGSSRRGVTPPTDWIPSWWINCSCSCGRQSRWGAGRSLASMAPPAVTNIESIKIDGWDSMRIASTRRTVSSMGFSPTMGKPMVPLLFTRQCGSPWSRRPDRPSDHGTKAAQMPRLESIPTSTSQTTPIRTWSIWTARSHKAHKVHPRRLMPNLRPSTDLRSEPPPPRAEPAHRFPAIRVPSSRHSGWVHPPFHWLCTSSILTVCEGGSRPLGGTPRRLAAWTPPVWVRPIHASSTPHTTPHRARTTDAGLHWGGGTAADY